MSKPAPIKEDTLGSRIREARKRLRFSASEVARQVGVSRAAVGQWETDASEPAAGNLRKLAQILEVELEWLGQGKGLAPWSMPQPPKDDAMWVIWKQATPSERQLIVNIANTILASRKNDK